MLTDMRHFVAEAELGITFEDLLRISDNHFSSEVAEETIAS